MLGCNLLFHLLSPKWVNYVAKSQIQFLAATFHLLSPRLVVYAAVSLNHNVGSNLILLPPESEAEGLRSDLCQTLSWFQHVTRHDRLSKNILQDVLEGGQCHSWQRKCWMDIKEWTSLLMPEVLTKASCRKRLEENLPIHPSCLPDDPVGQVIELN